MAWIEVHQNLLRHPKTLRCAAALGVDRFTMVGHLVNMWCWALDAKPDGGPLDDIDIRAATEWAGRKDISVALAAARFLDERDGQYWLHDWDDYTSRLRDQRDLRRLANRESQRRRRARLSAEQMTGHDDVSPDKRDSQHSTVPNPTVPNPTQSGESDPLVDFVTSTLGFDVHPSRIEGWGVLHDEPSIRAAVLKAAANQAESVGYVESILKNNGPSRRNGVKSDPYQHLYRRD